MIVTVTVNPSLDRTVVLEGPLRPGDVQSVVEAREDAGGKGINVSRVLDAASEPTLAVLPLAPSDPYASALSATGMPIRSVPVTRHARANLTITDPDGCTTKLNLSGAELSRDDADALIEAVLAETRGASWLVLAGSLPPGVGDDLYVRIIHAVRDRLGADAPKIAVDASGAALRATVELARPDLIKPNDEELEELVGVSVREPDDLFDSVVELANELVPGKVGAALVTLGARGAVLVRTDAVFVADAPRIDVVSTVGAGDSSLAGYLLGEVAGDDAEQCLRRAVRYGAAAALLPGTQAPRPSDLPLADVRVRQLNN